MLSLRIDKLRFELPYLKGDLYAWTMTDAKLFQEPIAFQPTRGCQRFMQVNREFWRSKFGPETSTQPASDNPEPTPARSPPSCSRPTPDRSPPSCSRPTPDRSPPSSDRSTPERSCSPGTALIITLTAEETERILQGDQHYLLRSQRAQLGKIHLAVKSLGFTIPGTVDFESVQEFTSLKTFKKWDGIDKCNPSDVLPGSTVMKRLQAGKTVYVTKLTNPEKFTTCIEWCAAESWSKRNLCFSFELSTVTLGIQKIEKLSKPFSSIKKSFWPTYFCVFFHCQNQKKFGTHGYLVDTKDRKAFKSVQFYQKSFWPTYFCFFPFPRINKKWFGTHGYLGDTKDRKAWCVPLEAKTIPTRRSMCGIKHTMQKHVSWESIFKTM